MRKIFCLLLIAAIAVQIKAMPADAAKPAAPAKPADPAKPAAPAKPAEPAAPAAPHAPKEPHLPLGPLQEIAKVGTSLLETGEKCISSFFGLFGAK